MTGNSFSLILSRQFRQKWGRFLLSSGGIMVGVWALTLTTALSLGVRDTLVEAINSQPLAREVTIQKSVGGETDLLQFTGPPKFAPIKLSELESIKQDNSYVIDVKPNSLLQTFLRTPENQGFNCVDASVAVAQNAQLPPNAAGGNVADLNPSQVSVVDFQSKCANFLLASGVFDSFYQNNKANWYGQTQPPKPDEIVMCFRCGNTQLNTALGLDNPEDMLGREITLEFAVAPEYLLPGQQYDVVNPQVGNSLRVAKSNPKTFRVVSVVDDRDSGFGGFSPAYIDLQNFVDAIVLADPQVNPDDIGFLEANIVIDNYSNLTETVNKMRSQGYLATSLAQLLIQAVEYLFTGLSVVLAGFGFIALIASVFGIVNVMTISVLERKKEIGILKSLGARDRDIFSIFFLESLSLGVLGWLLGTSLAYLMGVGTSLLSAFVIQSNDAWQQNLSAVNITSFDPSFPWWLLLSTLVLAIIFTTLSGVFPAISASRQNPVDVLRSE